jgi:hypothetical protein
MGVDDGMGGEREGEAGGWQPMERPGPWRSRNAGKRSMGKPFVWWTDKVELSWLDGMDGGFVAVCKMHAHAVGESHPEEPARF